MAKITAYQTIVVESFMPDSTSGRHGKVHMRPAAGQIYPQTLFVECGRQLLRDYPVGTKFRIRVKLADVRREGEFLYSYHSWPFEVVTG